MHSSRMRTAHSLTISHSIHQGGMHAKGACVLRGMCVPGGIHAQGVCAWRVSMLGAWPGVCMPRGMCGTMPLCGQTDTCESITFANFVCR